MPRLWALIISIECYVNPSWPPVDGAHIDGRNTLNYLTEDLNVPEDRIVYLKDAEATRNNIIATFQSHLIDNSRIQRGDAILLHYSGHGSFLKAPAGWTVVEEKSGDENRDDLLEVIIPWDEGTMDSATGYPTCGIPDRTLAALINRAANAHGNNITVVLDCCCSGHGTRGGDQGRSSDDEEELRPRAVDPSLLSPLYTELDEGLGVKTPFTVSKANRGRVKALNADHVLMAACGSREEAMGGAKSGGIFTRSWLSALRRKDIYPRTYAEILKVINASIEDLRRTHRFISQHPQCDGIVRDRLVFEEVMMRADVFDAVPIVCLDVTGNTVEIAAGQVHGIEAGTIFEVHSMSRFLESQRMVGTAIARRVDATMSIAELPAGIPLAAPKYSALVTSPPERLRYTLTHDNPPSYQAEQSVRLFRASVSRMSYQEAQRLVEVGVREPSDLQLNFEADGSLTLYRLDPLIGSLRNRPPRLSPTEIEAADFVNIFNAIAKFNRLLALTSVTRPFADQVAFELRHLTKRNGGDYEGFYIPETSTPVEIVDEEATLVQPTSGEEEDYAIVLHSNLSKNLFVQVWYFDPNTYGIARCYSSPDFEKPTLAGNGGTLQLGASTELAEPLRFYLPEGATSDTIFAKVLLTDQPTRLDFMQQDDVIGSDQDGRSFILDNDSWNRAGGEEVGTKGEWDVLCRKITVVEVPG
ncbi:hypothetical protein BC629DRAFT_413695 [Irpex lacteus]|nr:hypothetical protein BC629DRAFT_413695 [Irpex lacteus]